VLDQVKPMLLSKILMPIDFSERCLGTTRYAIPLVEHFKSELTLLHVVSPIDDLSPEATTLNADRRQKAQKALDDFLCAALNHLNPRRILREGDPAEVIVDQACQDQSDMIMMPTHGYGPFRRLLLGSVTAKVLHDSPCPVWTGVHLAQGPPVEWLTPRQILCALDLRPGSAAVLRWANGRAAAFQSEFTILHVEPRLDSPGEEFFAHEWRRHVLAQAAEAVAQLQTSEGTRAQIMLEAGDVSDAASRAVRELNADLLVIGRGKSADARLGTHTYDIIRKSPCPVVSV
jgi:nucleotide-binding universal stress UspA family protein